MRPPTPSTPGDSYRTTSAKPPQPTTAVALSGLLRVKRRWSLAANAAENFQRGHPPAGMSARSRLPPHLEEGDWARLVIGIASDVLRTRGLPGRADLVHLEPETVTVHVPTREAPPRPFRPGQEAGTWVLPRDTREVEALPVTPAITGATSGAALVTVTTTHGRRTLVDLVGVGSSLLSGPQAHVGIKLAEIAVELGTRRWSDLGRLVLIGFDLAMPQLDGACHVADIAGALTELGSVGSSRAGSAGTCVIVPPWVAPSGLSDLVVLAEKSPLLGVLHCSEQHTARCTWELTDDSARLSFRDGRTVGGLDVSGIGRWPRTRPSASPRPQAMSVEVSVLGDVQVIGATESFRQRRRLTELVAYLAMHPEGATSEAFATALWPERRVPVQTVANRLSEARRALGLASDGRARLRKVGRRHLIAECVTDWDRFRALSSPDLEPVFWRNALALVRGRPFGGLERGEWTHLEGFAAGVEAAVVTVACRAGEQALAANDAGLAHWAALQGLLASPWDERLYRLLMRAADALGNRGGVDAALRKLAMALEIEGDPLLGVHPETSELYRRLTYRARA